MKLEEIKDRPPSWIAGLVASVAHDRLLDVKDELWRSEFSRFHAAVRQYTECGNARLRSLYEAVRRVEREGVPGDVVECGTARGGSGAMMGLTLDALGADRTLWLFDTFEGLPQPSAADPDRELAELYIGGFRGGYDDVQALFERLGILDRTRMVKGLFQDTLHTVEIESVAVLHLDGDWYDSLLVCLDNFWERVSPGGVIQFDDYGHWSGARQAIDEFLERSISPPLQRIDYTGRLLIKP